jgi:hypothetical protein
MIRYHRHQAVCIVKPYLKVQVKENKTVKQLTTSNPSSREFVTNHSFPRLKNCFVSKYFAGIDEISVSCSMHQGERNIMRRNHIREQYEIPS